MPDCTLSSLTSTRVSRSACGAVASRVRSSELTRSVRLDAHYTRPAVWMTMVRKSASGTRLSKCHLVSSITASLALALLGAEHKQGGVILRNLSLGAVRVLARQADEFDGLTGYVSPGTGCLARRQQDRGRKQRAGCREPRGLY